MHLLSCIWFHASLQTVIKVSNILSWCKALADTFSFVLNSKKITLKLAISLLKSYIFDDAVVADLLQSSMSLVSWLVSPNE